MALTRCPECRKKISESAQFCPNCGFSFKEEDLEIYKQKLEERGHRQHHRAGQELLSADGRAQPQL